MPSSAGLPQVQALHLQAWDQMEQGLDLRREGFLLGCPSCTADLSSFHYRTRGPPFKPREVEPLPKVKWRSGFLRERYYHGGGRNLWLKITMKVLKWISKHLMNVTLGLALDRDYSDNPGTPGTPGRGGAVLVCKDKFKMLE